MVIVNCFRDLQNYTTLKQSVWIHNEHTSFRDLQNYTTLKQGKVYTATVAGFRDLQNYTTLKLVIFLLFRQ